MIELSDVKPARSPAAAAAAVAAAVQDMAGGGTSGSSGTLVDQRVSELRRHDFKSGEVGGGMCMRGIKNRMNRVDIVLLGLCSKSFTLSFFFFFAQEI